MSARADKEAIATITNVHRRLAALQALLRSCRLRFSQAEGFIDECGRLQEGDARADECGAPLTQAHQAVLRQADCDINMLIVEVRALMKR